MRDCNDNDVDGSPLPVERGAGVGGGRAEEAFAVFAAAAVVVILLILLIFLGLEDMMDDGYRSFTKSRTNPSSCCLLVSCCCFCSCYRCSVTNAPLRLRVCCTALFELKREADTHTHTQRAGAV